MTTDDRQHPLVELPASASQIVAALHAYYDRPNVVSFAELRVGTGYGKDAEQRIDFWVMDLMPSQSCRRIAIEIKVSRSDFLNEIKHPTKRRRALLLSNEFYFATPPGLVKIEELPPECGLVEVHPDHGAASDALFGDIAHSRSEGARTWMLKHSQKRLHFKVAAPWRDSNPPSWRFVAALLRRAAKDGL
jgi:hypothetical protein